MINAYGEILIGIIGAGTMGSGIAQVAATAGHQVILYDENSGAVEKAKRTIQDSLIKLEQKGRLVSGKSQEIFSQVKFTDQMEKLSKCNFIIEAIIEELSAKQKVFQEIEKIVSSETILATNASSLSVTAIFELLSLKSRTIGTHFFNPPALLPLVEIIPTGRTSSSTIEFSKDLFVSWGKATVVCKDTPGFIVNRAARPFYLEALRMLEEGFADVVTIDVSMKECGKFKMGPFELMDLIGNDINYKVTEAIYERTNRDPRYEPPRIQKNMVTKNLLGRKTGKGFYDYNNPGDNPLPKEINSLKEKIFMRIISVLINEAAEMVSTGTANVCDIDKAVILGVNYPKGLLRWADEIGIDKIISELELLSEGDNKERYKPSQILIEMKKGSEKFYNSRKIE